MARFKIGDTVKGQGHIGKIVDIFDSGAYGNETYYQVRLDGRPAAIMMLESDLTKLHCECGAKFNRDFPDIHSRWCPMHMEIK